MNSQLLAQLRHLKLGGMARALQTQQEQVGTYEGLPFMERLSLLIEQENLSREHNKHARLIRQARFKLSATVQDIDYQHSRNLNRSQVARLAQGDWIPSRRNVDPGDQSATDRSVVRQHRRQHAGGRHPGPADA